MIVLSGAASRWRSSTANACLRSRPVGAHNSVVGADQGFRAPSWAQESVRDSVHEDSASAPIAAGQRPRQSFRHPYDKIGLGLPGPHPWMPWLCRHRRRWCRRHSRAGRSSFSRFPPEGSPTANAVECCFGTLTKSRTDSRSGRIRQLAMACVGVGQTQERSAASSGVGACSGCGGLWRRSTGRGLRRRG